MSDERFADEVGAHLREEEASADPRLERLARGQSSETERAELEREAKGDPALAEALQILTPAAGESRDRLVRVATEAAAPKRRAQLTWIGVAAGGLAAAAIALLSVSEPRPLPAMRMSVSAGDLDLRGADVREGAARTVSPDSEITLSLRPERSIEGPLDAAVFAVREGRARRVDVAVDLSEDGAVRARASARALTEIEAGAATIVLAVARRGHLPGEAALPAEGGATGAYAGPGWHLAQVRVVVRPIRGPPTTE